MPTLNMKVVDKNTNNVVSSSSISASVTSANYIYFSLTNSLSSFVSYPFIVLHFKQTSSSTSEMFVNVTNENKLISSEKYPLKCVNIDGEIYREVDVTDLLLNNQMVYLAIYEANGLVVYTDHADDDLRPTLITSSISENEFIKNQEYISGSSSFDTYSLNIKDDLYRFLEDGHIPMTNNLAERTVKPFVILRKNCLLIILKMDQLPLNFNVDCSNCKN